MKYPNDRAAPHSERAYTLRVNFSGIGYFVAMLASGVMLMFVGVMLVIGPFVYGFDFIVELFGNQVIVSSTVITVVAVGLYFVLKKVFYRNLADREYFYEYVGQGMILGHPHSSGRNGPVVFYVKIVGYNRQNELKRYDQPVPVEKWREYKEGEYVSFDDTTPTP